MMEIRLTEKEVKLAIAMSLFTKLGMHVKTDEIEIAVITLDDVDSKQEMMELVVEIKK